MGVPKLWGAKLPVTPGLEGSLLLLLIFIRDWVKWVPLNPSLGC